MKKDEGRRMVKEKEVADGISGRRGKKKPACIVVARAVLRMERIQHFPYRRTTTTHTPPNLYCQQPILQETDKSLRNHRGKLCKPVLIKMRE